MVEIALYDQISINLQNFQRPEIVFHFAIGQMENIYL